MILRNISLFQIIVEKGSLTAAAREVGLSTTTVSERHASLEAHFGVVLLNRTTRSISLTAEGQMLMDGARVILGDVEDLESRIKFGARTLSGPIRISAPSDLGCNTIAPAINRFLEEHPAVSIDLLLSDGFVDIVGSGVDIAIRFGQISDSSLRSRSLGEKQRLVCASPRYIEKHGAPATPADLKMHNCLLMRFGENLDNVWRFGKGKSQQLITVSGDRVANHGGLVRQWCLEGQGIGLKSELDVRSDIGAGNLVELLASYAPPPTPLQMLFPPSRAQPKRVRKLADEIALLFA